MTLLRLIERSLHLEYDFSLTDWLTLVESWLLLAYFHLATYFIGYNRLEMKIKQDVNNFMDESRCHIFGEHIEHLVGYASRCHLVPMTCLTRSLTVQKILTGRNIPAQIRIGVQKKQGAFFAHAWVEISGKPIGESDDVTKLFNVLDTVTKLNAHHFK